jgi:glycine/D-amino acid oxidase-like deaminating enzyme
MANSSAVAVVGAGLIGGSIAWRLTQRGANVMLADAGTFGGETSSAGAGMLSPGGEFETQSRWLDLGVEGMRMYPSFVAELAEESGMAIDFALCGSQYFVDSETARRRTELQTAAGIRVEPGPDGLYYPDDGYVDPSNVLRALRRACETRGADIVEHREIPEIDAGEFRAVVISAGAWSSQIRVTHNGRAIDLPPVEPIKGHLIGFDLDPGSLGHMLRRGHDYLLQRANGFTVAGSTEEHANFDRTVSAEVCEGIARRAATLFPALASRSPSARWIGFRPFSPEGPHIRRVEGTNVWLAYGHFRNGILLAPLTAARIAAEITEVAEKGD